MICFWRLLGKSILFPIMRPSCRYSSFNRKPTFHVFIFHPLLNYRISDVIHIKATGAVSCKLKKNAMFVGICVAKFCRFLKSASKKNSIELFDVCRNMQITQKICFLMLQRIFNNKTEHGYALHTVKVFCKKAINIDEYIEQNRIMKNFSLFFLTSKQRILLLFPLLSFMTYSGNG